MAGFAKQGASGKSNRTSFDRSTVMSLVNRSRKQHVGDGDGNACDRGCARQLTPIEGVAAHQVDRRAKRHRFSLEEEEMEGRGIRISAFAMDTRRPQKGLAELVRTTDFVLCLRSSSPHFRATTRSPSAILP